MTTSHIRYKQYLPLWTSVIFVDWFGVLSTDLFWHTILENEKHPYYQMVRNVSEKLFQEDKEEVQKWMRGDISAQEILASVEISLDNRAKENFLVRRLFNDCRKIRFQTELLKSIREMSTTTCIVVATDNMDCFTEQFQLMPKLNELVDDILSSSRMGVLKTDSIESFFNPWLSDHRLGFERALLIDDNHKTCEKFRFFGGTAIEFGETSKALVAIKQWLGSQPGVNAKSTAG